VREDILFAVRGHRPFEQHRLLFRAGPFAAMYAAAFALYPLGGSDMYGGWFIASVATALATVGAIAVAPWQRLPRSAQILPLLTFVASVALLREAHGGSHSAYAPMVLLAVAWAALFASGFEFLVVTGSSALAIAVPPAIDGSNNYPADEFRRAVIILLVSVAIGLGARLLIQALLDAEAKLLALRATEIHDDLVQAFAAARLALELGDTQTADRAVQKGLEAAQALTARMLEEAAPEGARAGTLRRERSSPG
jgi:signal transduction histidine kinase